VEAKNNNNQNKLNKKMRKRKGK